MPQYTTHFHQIHRPTARGIARHAAVGALALARSVTGQIDRSLARPRVHFVYLHHVFQDEVEPFRRLVRELTKRMTPITYSDAVSRCVNGAIDRPYICFSFDDGFKNCLTAASILEEFGARACFFVCASIVGERDAERLARFTREKLHLPPMEFMDDADLVSLQSRGHEIGNHTLSHENLGRPTIDVREQVEQGLSLLKRSIGDVKHFAWPYGRFDAITPTARDLVFASGHESCASGQRGAHVTATGDANRLCIRRDHVIAAWPLRHVLYLLAASADRATARDNDWPQ